jgi:tetratricopeptide (TPR) repeat protein
MRLLRTDLEAAIAGEGRLVTLVGEPGVGKTRTAMALAGDARSRDAAVVWDRCNESGGAPVYWPWRQALGALAADTLASEATALAALLPDLHAGVGPGAAADVPDRARFELFDRVADALRRTTRARPVVLVIDDLHWADAGSWLLLEFVAREIGGLRLLVLGTYRASDLAGRPEIAGVRSAVLRLAHGIPLGGLSVAALRELMAEHLGQAPDDALVAEIAGLTDSNPFFVTEVLRLLATATPGGSERLPIPPGVEQLLHRRLAALPDASRRLLEAAAVAGRDFELTPLVAVLGTPLEALLDALTPALDAGIVRAAGERLRRYVFTHALMRDCVYERLAPSTRGALHAAVGAALEAGGPPDGDRLALLAHHFYEAARAGDPAKAIHYGCAAGEHALGVLAFEEAVRHFERALAAVAVAGDEALRLRALAGLGEAAAGAGLPGRAHDAFRDAVALSRRQGAQAFADTVLRYSSVRAEFGLLDVEMNALLDEALATLGEERSARRARLLARLAAGLSLQGGAERRRRALADEATALARALDDPPTLEGVLMRRLIALLGPDAIDARLATSDEILHTPTSSRASDLGALLCRADDLAQLGDRPALDQTLAAFEQKARASRQPLFRWMVASVRTTIALLEGRFTDAEVLAAETLQLGQPVQAQTAVLYYAQQLFVLRGWQARFAEIQPFIEAGASTVGVIPAWRCTLAHFYELSGRRVEARREFDGVAAGDFASLPRDAGWLGAMHQLARVCARLDDAARAAVLYEQLRPFAGRVAVAWPLVVIVGPIDQSPGVLAATLARYDAAEAHFADAMAVSERMRALPW